MFVSNVIVSVDYFLILVQEKRTAESVGGNIVRLPRFIPMTLALLFCAMFIVVVGHSEDHARNQQHPDDVAMQQ